MMGHAVAGPANSHVQVRAFEEKDLDAAHALSVAVGWPHRLRDWRAVFRIGSGLVACDAMARVVGTAMLWRLGADFGTVGMVIVVPGLQGRGIARYLMQTLLATAVDCTLQLNATAAGKQLYESIGFRSIGTIHQHQGIVRRLSDPPAAPGVRPSTSADWEQIAAVDRAATGIDRSAALQAMVGGATGTVITQDGSITGFAFSRPFGRGHVVGPVVAPDDATATALIQPHLEKNVGRFLRLDTPHHGGPFARLLEQSGLILVDRAETMVRGTEPTRSDRARVFALVNQALG